MSDRPLPCRRSLACRLFWAAAPVLIAAGSGMAQPLNGYESYIDWHGWARVQLRERAGLASSYDRSGGNLDFSQYESPPGLLREVVTATVKTIQGPGVIYRLWMPHLTTKKAFPIRMYFDGETTPRIDTTSDALLGGTFGYLSAPLITTAAGGRVSYEPIPFATSVRIETVNRQLPPTGWSHDAHYYQYSYRIFPAGTPVESYTPTPGPAVQAARSAVADLFANPGQHPAGDNPAAITLHTPGTTIPPGGTLELADLGGPGVIRRLCVKMSGPTDAQLDGLLLRVYYHGSPTPAIDVPVGDFFGAGHGRALYRSIPLGTDSPDGYYCYWPMPFHKRVRIELTNSTAAGIPIASALVEYEQGPLGLDMGLLHARVNRSVRSGVEGYHPVLSVTGRGHYVGSFMYLRQEGQAFQILEGDDITTVDGAYTLYGTGLEDTYNGGYYFNWSELQNDEPEGTHPSSATRPLHGILHVSQTATQTRADAYRWMIADRVPFVRSIEVKQETFYALSGSQWASVAFWYQLPPVTKDFDGDLDVDGQDLSIFRNCLTGPAGGPVTGPCEAADYDYDDDVDQTDFGYFQPCLTGSGFPLDPEC